MRLELFDVSKRWPRQRTQWRRGQSREQRDPFHCLLFNLSALYYLQTPTQRYGHASTPPQFLPISGDRDVSLLLSFEWPLWSSSSGNNYHAVHRSLSSCASLFLRHSENFYLVSYCEPNCILHNYVCTSHRNSQLFRNLFCYNSCISQNESIDWIHRFRCAHHGEHAWHVLILNTNFDLKKQKLAHFFYWDMHFVNSKIWWHTFGLVWN